MLSTCPGCTYLPQDILEKILDHLDLSDLITFGACCCKFHESHDSYFKHRFLHTIALYNLSPASFLSTLHQTGAIIGRSFVLSLILPVGSLSWKPASLDIFVSHQHAPALHTFFLVSGYTNLLGVRPQIPSSMHSHISSIHVYTLWESTIKVFITWSPFPITPIVHAPLTCLMNVTDRFSFSFLFLFLI